MRIYVVYVLCDYATAVYMSTNKKLAQKELEAIKKNGRREVWIKSYDLTGNNGVDLDCS